MENLLYLTVYETIYITKIILLVLISWYKTFAQVVNKTYFRLNIVNLHCATPTKKIVPYIEAKLFIFSLKIHNNSKNIYINGGRSNFLLWRHKQKAFFLRCQTGALLNALVLLDFHILIVVIVNGKYNIYNNIIVHPPAEGDKQDVYTRCPQTLFENDYRHRSISNK